MAWRSSGNTNAQLVDNLFKNAVFSSARILDVMKSVDRAHFVSAHPYQDSPQSIGFALFNDRFNATISAPHMHAVALETLLPHISDSSRLSQLISRHS